MSECKYRLPCGWCDRINAECAMKPKVECQHRWVIVPSLTISDMQHYRCELCGETKEEPFTVLCDKVTLDYNSTGFHCDHHWVNVTTSKDALHNVDITK